MSESALKGPVSEDVLAVTGHCCSVRLTHLPALAAGIDFTPDAAARMAFEKLQLPVASASAAAAGPAGTAGDLPAADPPSPHDSHAL